jgi:tRNA1(Val) A37 N6-methylase TrmN6
MFLYQPTNGYCYNSDSIFLYNFIKLFNPKGRVLDVGCGIGILSLLICRDFDVDMTIIDKQKKMLTYAEHNFSINGLVSDKSLSDFLSYKSSDKFDMIISNPPFYGDGSIQSRDEHLNISRYASHLPFDKFAKNVKSLLRPKGRFIFCYDAKQIDNILYQLKLNKINPETIRFVHSKIDRESKLVMISARNNSMSMSKILPPLIVFDNDSLYLAEASLAFDVADTHSIKGDF